MTNLELPIWLFIALTALHGICLLVLAISIVKKRRQAIDRKVNLPAVTAPPVASPNNTFQNDLNALQIDTVFNAISALIEMERVKLKNLICAGIHYESDPPAERNESDLHGTIDNQCKGISHIISERAESGESSDDIAKSLGISRNEVELAKSIFSKSENKRGGRLEAVA